jgi:hypothetical protein
MARAGNKTIRTRKLLLLTALTLGALAVSDCTYYRDPRAEVIVTSNRAEAVVYLVPVEVTVPKPPTRPAMEKYAVGSTSSKRGIWVDYGLYWLVLEKDGTWSQPVEFEVRYDYLNKVHVDF